MGKKILIVDDAAFMRKILGDILKRNNFEVVGEAVNGVEAVEKFKELKPDIVTMDITMPEKDGIEALKDIITIDSEAIVIMCTAMGQQNMVLKAIDSGAKDFIVKPFKPETVLEAIEKAINSH